MIVSVSFVNIKMNAVVMKTTMRINLVGVGI